MTWNLRLAYRAVAVVTAAALPACGPSESDLAPADITVYEGARLIVGDGSVIDDATFVVEEGRFTMVGARGAISVPAGTRHVDLTGRTVMPAIVNTHVHLASTREERLAQLEHMA
jgi:imidazolonepropionase-like amidohydrolase